jgi:hypothetical protein
MVEIVRPAGFTVEQYILRNIYELAVLYIANGNKLSVDSHSWAHDDVKGCLFDMNSNKRDITFSLHQPTLCDVCRGKVTRKRLDAKFLPTLSKELQKLKKSLYFQISDWVMRSPILALVVTTLFAILLNLIASGIYEMFISKLLKLVG